MPQRVPVPLAILVTVLTYSSPLFAQLSEHGILAPDELASDQGRPYYYVERAEGAVLLAPER